MAVTLGATSDAEVPAMNGTIDRPTLQPWENTPRNCKKGSISTGPQQNGYHHSSPEYAISMQDQHAFMPRKIRVITIGAGFSGLIIAHKFQHRFPELQEFIDHKIFEARGDIGGTWLVNTYPGVQCDVPSHIYVSHGKEHGKSGDSFGVLIESVARRSLSTRTQTGLNSTQVVKRSMITSRRQLQSGISNET